MNWLFVDGNVVLDACLVMYLSCDMIYGHGCGLCLIQMLHAIKNFKFHTFDYYMITHSFKWYQSHLSHDLHAQMLIIASVMIIHVDICKCCD